jgi:tRNA threonylcarbamoyladenosine biosynthesis protein TsaE
MNHKPDGSSSPSGYICTTRSSEQSTALGRIVGQQLNSGLSLLLYGDLGSGKTAFSQGLARGLDVPEVYAITSPTYTLINEYPGRLPFYHVDLYRLKDPIDPEELGLDEIMEENVVVAVEWSDRLHPQDRPSQRLDLFFSVTGENQRSVNINGYGLGASNLLNHPDTYRLLKKEGIELARSL